MMVHAPVRVHNAMWGELAAYKKDCDSQIAAVEGYVIHCCAMNIKHPRRKRTVPS